MSEWNVDVGGRYVESMLENTFEVYLRSVALYFQRKKGESRVKGRNLLCRENAHRSDLEGFGGSRHSEIKWK